MRVSFYATLRLVVGDKTVDIPLQDGATLRELVDAIIEKFPPLGPMLLNDAGELSRHVQIFVNGRSSRHLGGQLEMTLTATDKVDVFPAVAGGAG
jgi:molybdopterin synthase sulfur carrier subunit